MLAASLVGSCKHDLLVDDDPTPPTVQKDTCLSFDSATAGCDGGITVYDLEPAFTKPCYNPLNSAEFVYMTGGKLYKYNMETSNKTLLLEGIPIIGQIDWSLTGWLTFSTQQWKVWKVKDNGTGLTQLTFTPSDLYPEFNPDGNRIIYLRSMEYSNEEIQQNPELAYRSKMMIIDLNGKAVDSICIDNGKQCMGWRVCGWSSENTIAHTDGELNNQGVVLSSFDFSTGKNSAMCFSYSESTDIRDIERHSDNQRIFFTDVFGIKVLSVESNDVHIIKESCDARFYQYISISPDGQHILAQRGTSEVKTICDIDRQWEIVKMDIDGRHETVIPLAD